ncbi:hypothetical protein GCM10008910_44590 [Faecalicatena orotica]
MAIEKANMELKSPWKRAFLADFMLSLQERFSLCLWDRNKVVYTQLMTFCSRITKNEQKVVCTFVEQSVLNLAGLYSTVVVKKFG